jgi:3-oxoacyl-[acyl-carrier protein] reductase
VAFISAAAGPMGAATARRFLQEGAQLLLVDISQRRLDEVAAQLNCPDRVEAIRANALVESEVAAAVQKGISRFGRIDIAINIVGGVVADRLATPMIEMSEASIDATFALNLKTIFTVSRHVVPGMQARRYGRIVNISSVFAAGEGGMSAYSAAKAGVIGLTRTMAIEFAPAITVNCIAPSLVRTRVLERLDPQVVETYIARTLLKRAAEPEDIANAALFLASDESAYITAATLPLTGGSWAGA